MLLFDIDNVGPGHRIIHDSYYVRETNMCNEKINNFVISKKKFLEPDTCVGTGVYSCHFSNCDPSLDSFAPQYLRIQSQLVEHRIGTNLQAELTSGVFLEALKSRESSLEISFSSGSPRLFITSTSVSVSASKECLPLSDENHQVSVECSNWPRWTRCIVSSCSSKVRRPPQEAVCAYCWEPYPESTPSHPRKHTIEFV